MKRVRTKHFVVTGAAGGLVGFFLMEILRRLFPSGGSWLGEVVALAIQFAGFGLAVGAALGMTEGLVRKKGWRLLYGLTLGLVLGTAGGCAGGAVGQTIFSLLPAPPVPERPGTDIAVALDASGSMKQFFFFGSDPDGKRKEAALKLVELLGAGDRVAIVGFNHTYAVLFPLTALDSKAVRRQARKAIQKIGNSGGTSLDAGLGASLTELVGQTDNGRSQHVIFLTDGVGEFHDATLQPALEHGIKIYTVGLGSGVDRPLLEDIAARTDGAYYPVDNASDLWQAFEAIYKDNIGVDMASHSQDGGLNPLLLFLFRVLSWGAMGLVIGIGQGIRENTAEDLRACSLGGLAGGLVGGALFNPISDVLAFGGGIFGRCAADVTVGAWIGGSMRFAQGIVLQDDKPTKSLTVLLPEKNTSLVLQDDSGRRPGHLEAPISKPPKHLVERDRKGMKGLVLQMKHTIEGRTNAAETPVASTHAPSAPTAVASSATPATTSPPAPPTPSETVARPEPSGRRKPLSFYQSRYSDDRVKAMAMAFRSGHYPIEDIAEHFGVQRGRVVRAVRQHQQ